MPYWKKFQNNPCGKSVGDCAVRAISAALGVDWFDAYNLLCAEGKRQCDVMNADTVWGEVLRQHGFVKAVIPYMTAADFAERHPQGVYVLAFGGHVATVRDGFIWDSWNSSREIPIFYYRR